MSPSPATEALPSLPEPHLKALEACGRQQSYRQITDIIQLDTALSSRILILANATGNHYLQPINSLEQALQRLGTNRLEHLVLVAALQQMMFDLGDGQWRKLHGFWHEALAAALLCRALARLTRYPATDTAFLSGMLHNAGKLLLLRQELNLPNRPSDTGYVEMSVSLAGHWQLAPDVLEALAHQQANMTTLGSAGHLARLVAVAVQLITREGHGLTMARTLFGLEEELTAEILRRIWLETEDLAREMGVAALAHYDGNRSTRRLTIEAVRELLARDLLSQKAPPVSEDRIRQQVHEINNPLTVVRQYLYQLRKRLSETGDARDIDIIEEELGRASELLSELVAGNPEATSDQRNGHHAILNHEVEALRNLLADGLFRERQVTCLLELCDEPTAISAPAAQVRQVMLNLLRNAAECRPASPVQIMLRSTAPVWQQNRQWVEVTIADDGPGLPVTVRQNLFKPVATGKGEAHSGLGLSIVKQLMDDMDAIISCQSGPSGTLFRLLFPAGTETEDR
ncbi:HDOD domain-containing protein [Marinobacter lacisalsi]|uniref:histidine kinase n=1 Tax=Marinobacter lacisalsi TaxID=475979 RepID=A0ABV8QFM8_9GAMM